MPEQYLAQSPDDQKDILQVAAVNLGRQTSVLEKDIWVCWVLKALFTIPDAHPMAFKGGTSLSKIFNAIDRFSEDVDISLDYRGFEPEFDPFADGTSNSQIKKFTRRLKDYVKAYSYNTIAPFLQEAINQLPTPERYKITIDDTGEKIWVNYPSVTESSDAYLKSQILIELGGRNVIDPNERHTVSPYVAPITPSLEYPSSEVVVLSPGRTFWEKATLIHVECNRGQMKQSAERLSRHWYDLFTLSQHPIGEKAVHNRDLFEDVVKHKKVFFNASYANYHACLTGNLQLVPDEETLTNLRKDFGSMISAGMMYETNISDFKDIEEKLRDVEKKINDW